MTVAQNSLFEPRLAILALLIAIGLASLASRTIIRPVLDLSDPARSLAEGDLTHRAYLIER